MYTQKQIPTLPGGVELPRVSNILDVAADKGKLDLQKTLGFDAVDFIFSRAGETGTCVHHYAECFYNEVDDFKWTVEKKELEKARNCVKNFHRFQDKFELTPILLEQRVFNLVSGSPVIGYAGTVDGLFRSKEGKLIILDWKTSKEFRKKYRLQILAYYYAFVYMVKNNLISEPGVTLEALEDAELWVVNLNKTRRFNEEKDVKKIAVDRAEFELGFLSLLNHYTWDRSEQYAN